MQTNVLSVHNDPMGTAIADYYARASRGASLYVYSQQFDRDEIPLKTLFRNEADMPALERAALALASGRVLDVGAGSGCHALLLQERGFSVTALDISPLSVETMIKRGVKDARLVNLFDPCFAETYDTIFMLMNGAGIVGEVANMSLFFQRLKLILRPGGCVLLDSTDLRYVFENEDGSFDIDLNTGYYGEVDFRMEYKKVVGDWFKWLYVDFNTLAYYAAQNGFQAELLEEGAHYDYVAKLVFK